MFNYPIIAKCLIMFWPLLVIVQAYFYRRKQRSDKAWTGGEISRPKALWLAYTIYSWFFLPAIFLFHPDTSIPFTYFLIFHLFSWWIRGVLELLMIYKWYSWSPKYGITHDLFHLSGILYLIFYYRYSLITTLFGTVNFLILVYFLFLIFTTTAEIVFAYWFFKIRTEEELKGNIYFASDASKWKNVNRLTLLVVIVAFWHLLFQSMYAFLFL